MKSSKGFTLIELVIIIIILGVLVAAATPKYLDLRTETQKAVASGVLSAIMGADSILFANSVLNNTDYDEDSIISQVNRSVVTDIAISGGVGTITVDGEPYTFDYTAHTTEAAGQFAKNW